MSAERCLLLALESKDTYYLVSLILLPLNGADQQNFTLMELLRIVHIQDKRKVIFADTATNSQPDLTTAIWQELLIHLGRINQSIITRGGTRSLSRPITSATRPPSSDTRAIPLQSGAIFRPAIKQGSGIQSMFKNVLDGPIQPVPPQIANKAKQIEGIVEKQTEKAAQGALEWVERKPVSGPVLKNSASWLDSRVWSQLGREWARRNVVLCLGDMVLAQRIIESESAVRFASAELTTSLCGTICSLVGRGYIRSRPACPPSNIRGNCPIPQLDSRTRIGTTSTSWISRETKPSSRRPSQRDSKFIHRR